MRNCHTSIHYSWCRAAALPTLHYRLTVASSASECPPTFRPFPWKQVGVVSDGLQHRPSPVCQSTCLQLTSTSLTYPANTDAAADRCQPVRGGVVVGSVNVRPDESPVRDEDMNISTQDPRPSTRFAPQPDLHTSTRLPSRTRHYYVQRELMMNVKLYAIRGTCQELHVAFRY